MNVTATAWLPPLMAAVIWPEGEVVAKTVLDGVVE